MSKAVWIVLAVALLVGGSAFAGDGADCAAGQAAEMQAEHKCSATAQECLDHMAAQFRDRGWVGVELDNDEATGKLTVIAVEPHSPAMDGGFREGDVLVALNGVRLDDENKEKVYEAREKMTVGKTVTYTIERDGMKRDLSVTLARIPDNVLAKWVGRHMLEDHTSEPALALARN